MKRLIAGLLLLCLTLSGCHVLGERIKEPVTFYYLRADYDYFSKDGVFASEEREASGHREDLSYLLRLYLMGPVSEELTCPLPRSTWIIRADAVDDGITIILSELSADMTDLEFSLAGSCLALTCFDMTPANHIAVIAGERSVEFTRDMLIIQEHDMESLEETQ